MTFLRLESQSFSTFNPPTADISPSNGVYSRTPAPSKALDFSSMMMLGSIVLVLTSDKAKAFSTSSSVMPPALEITFLFCSSESQENISASIHPSVSLVTVSAI